MEKQKNIRRISNKKVEKCGDFFQSSLAKIFKNGKDAYSIAYVKHHWKDIVGENVAKNVFFANVSRGELLLYAKHPAWANEIKNFEDDIISKLNAFAGENLAKTIRFVSFFPKFKNSLSEDKEENLKKEIKLEELPINDKKKIEKKLSKVEDEELKKVLKNYGNTFKRVQNYRRDNLKKCKVCGKFTEEEVCEGCLIEKEYRLRKKIYKVLWDLPYFNYADIVKEVPEATPGLVKKVRVDMAQRLAKKIDGKDGVTFKSKCLTMLYRAIPPEFITDKMVSDTLIKFRFDLASPPEFKNNKKNENKKSFNKKS